MFQEIFQEGEFASCIVITFQVMAVSRVSPRDPDTIRAVPECREDKLGAYPAGTGHPDDPEIGRVLEPADSGKVCRAVTAPVTQKGGDFRFPVAHTNLLINYISLIIAII